MRQARSLHPDCEMMEDRLVMSTVPGHTVAPGFGMIELANPKPKPAAPSFTATAISTIQVSLSWTKVTGASKYLIEELVNGKWVQLPSVKKNFTQSTVSGLTPDSQYTFDVGYVKGGKHWETPKLATTLPLPKPTPPQVPNWTGTAISSSVIEVTWTPEPGTSYEVIGFDYGAPGWQVVQPFSTSYDGAYVYGLDPGTSYEFNVVAQNSAGTTAGTAAYVTTPNV